MPIHLTVFFSELIFIDFLLCCFLLHGEVAPFSNIAQLFSAKQYT